MVANALKLVGLAALLLISVGVWPNRRYGAAIAIGLCIIAAVVLHFVASQDGKAAPFASNRAKIRGFQAFSLQRTLTRPRSLDPSIYGVY